MLKVLLHDSSLVRLDKMKALASGITLFNEIKTTSDEKALIDVIQSHSFDFFILYVSEEKSKNALVKAFPLIKSLPTLFINPNFVLDEFSKVSKLEINQDELRLVPFLNSVASLLPNDTLKSNDQLINEYIPISLISLKKLTKTPCDLYLKMGTEKYLKIVNLDEEIQDFFLERYKNKGVNTFFVKKTDYYKYSDQLFLSVLPEEAKFESRVDYFHSSQEVIKELVQEMGINESVIKAVDEFIENSLEDLKDQKMTNLLKKFKYSKERYIYDHSSMTSLFAVSLCERFEWRNNALLQKLTFASMFHDFAFKDQKLAMLESSKEEINKLSSDQRKEVLNHPEVIRDMLATNPSVSSDVLNLVYRHHEGQMEESYPNQMSSLKLSLVECIFIVAHELSNQMYRIAFRSDKLSQVYFHMLKFMEHGNLKQVKPAFEVVFSKCKQLSA